MKWQLPKRKTTRKIHHNMNLIKAAGANSHGCFCINYIHKKLEHERIFEYMSICDTFTIKEKQRKKIGLTIGVCGLSFSLTPLLVISEIQSGHKCWPRNNYVLSRAPFLNCAPPSQRFHSNFKSPPDRRLSGVACLSNWTLILGVIAQAVNFDS